VGNGEQARDFTFVSDVVRAFVQAAQSRISGQVFNVGSGAPKSINYLVSLLDGPVEFIPKRPGEPDLTFADIGKIQKVLGWKPSVSFEDGVALMLEAIDSWKEAPVWDPEKIRKATETWFKYLDEKNLEGLK
jgi:UDP-glucose 4-epimerase